MVTRVADPARLEPIERASLDALRALQLERLQTTLDHTYRNVAPFRARCEAQQIHPDDLRTHEDLARFPFTTKGDLRQHYPFGMFAVPMDRVVRLHASSGTTGKPTVVGYTQTDVDTWANLVARSIRASGGEAGDRIHVAYGYGLFTGGLGAHYGAERLGATVIPISGGQTPRQVQLIGDFAPDLIMCTPSYLLNIADEFERQGMQMADASLQVGILGAEPWGEPMRRQLETRCGLDAVDIYGLSEVIGPGVANECIEAKDGPVVWEDHFYPEIVDPETGVPVAEGEVGELVFTSLTKQALPVVRYRTRDLTRLLPGTSRTMRRLEKITGRCDDMLIVRGVNVFPSQIEERVLAVEGLAPHYQLVLGRDGALDVLTVCVEPRSAAADGALLARQLTEQIKGFVGLAVNVRMQTPGSVPRSEGKAVRVVDQRGQPWPG